MSEHAGRLNGKKAIVTGAASGIGRAIAKSFVAEGAQVLAVDLPSTDWATDSQLSDNMGRLAIDITGDDAPQTIASKASELLGGIDILVNNAGIAAHGSVETTTDAVWNKVLQINVTAMFRLSREAVPFLKNSDCGRIINMGSIMSEMSGPETLAYITSKHAVAGMTKSMAVDLGKYGISANFLQPGSVITPLSEPFMNNQGYVDYWKQKTPLGRLGYPDDIAKVAVFLASEDSGYMSGAGIKVCGGATANI